MNPAEGAPSSFRAVVAQGMPGPLPAGEKRPYANILLPSGPDVPRKRRALSLRGGTGPGGQRLGEAERGQFAQQAGH